MADAAQVPPDDIAATAKSADPAAAPQGNAASAQPTAGQDTENKQSTESSEQSGADPVVTSDPADHQSPEPTGPNVLSIKKIQNIKIKVQAMLGGVSMSVSQLANLKQGEFVELETKIGDAIDILANGHLVARGEIIVIEEDSPRFGVTLTEVVDTETAP